MAATVARRHGLPPPRADDCSVQVHVCHSRMREVEVLYDQLVRLFEAFPDAAAC